MSENIFFDTAKLKKVGKNVIIGKTVRIRYPELVEIGDNCIIDDFTYISTQLILANNVHIGAGTKIIGGKNSKVCFGAFSTTAPNVVLAAGSDDYHGGIATPMVPMEFKGNVEYGDINFGKHCVIGANSTVHTNITFPDGASLGANCYMKDTPNEYEVWGGVPAKFLAKRNKQKILDLEQKYLNSLK